MKNLLLRLTKKKRIREIFINEKEIISFYKQLVKMKIKRPHINAKVLLKKCYPNIKDKLNKIIEDHEHSTCN
jgi:hypothetical protein